MSATFRGRKSVKRALPEPAIQALGPGVVRRKKKNHGPSSSPSYHITYGAKARHPMDALSISHCSSFSYSTLATMPLDCHNLPDLKAAVEDIGIRGFTPDHRLFPSSAQDGRRHKTSKPSEPDKVFYPHVPTWADKHDVVQKRLPRN